MSSQQYQQQQSSSTMTLLPTWERAASWLSETTGIGAAGNAAEMEAMAAAECPTNGSHTVLGGESLSLIAEQYTGNVLRYEELAQLNGIAAPYEVEVGRQLVLPQSWGQTPACPPPAVVEPESQSFLDAFQESMAAGKDAVAEEAGSWAAWWAEEESEVDSADALREEHLKAGKTPVLEEAIALTDSSDAGHGYDVRRDQSSKEIWAEIKSGEIDDLDAVMCSEFTAASMAAAGYDLDQDYRDPGTGLRVAYADKGGVTFLKMWMVAGTLADATAALMVVQDGAAERVEAGSDRAVELGEAGSEAFLYSEVTTFVGRDASTNHHVGAGAAAVAFGGSQVQNRDRKPGDVHQSFATDSQGAYTGGGHSSVVHGVRGHGVARLGVEGAPTIQGDVKSPGPAAALPPGWYSIDDASGLEWVIGPDTKAENVASLSVSQVQLVDANRSYVADESGEARGSDATTVGSFRADADGVMNSAGRLPTSPWFGWTPTNPDHVVPLSSSGTAKTTTSTETTHDSI